MIPSNIPACKANDTYIYKYQATEMILWWLLTHEHLAKIIPNSLQHFATVVLALALMDLLLENSSDYDFEMVYFNGMVTKQYVWRRGKVLLPLQNSLEL